MEPADTEFNEEPWAAAETAAAAETGGPTAPPKPAEPLSPQRHQEPPAVGKPKSSEAQAAPTQVDEAQAAEAQAAPSPASTLAMRGRSSEEDAEAEEAPPNPPHEVGEFFKEFVLPKLDAVEDKKHVSEFMSINERCRVWAPLRYQVHCEKMGMPTLPELRQAMSELLDTTYNRA